MPNEDWKEVTLAQLLGASSANPEPCDCRLHRLNEESLVCSKPIPWDVEMFEDNPFRQEDPNA